MNFYIANKSRQYDIQLIKRLELLKYKSTQNNEQNHKLSSIIHDYYYLRGCKMHSNSWFIHSTLTVCVCVCVVPKSGILTLFIFSVFYDHQIIYETRIELNCLGLFIILFHFISFCLFTRLASFKLILNYILYIFPYISINARTINFQIYQQTTKSIPKQHSFTLPSCAWKLKSLKNT